MKRLVGSLLTPDRLRVLGLPVPWIAFIIVQLFVLWEGWVLPNQPMGDVYNVYGPWSARALQGEVVGVTEPWVYPPVALVPMLLPRLLVLIPDYTMAWAVMVVILNFVAFGMLLGRGTSRARVLAASFWVLYALALGSIGMYRIDAVTVPIAVIAVLILARHPRVAGVLFAIGAWIKIWPGAMLVAAVMALRSRWQLLMPAIIFSGAVVLVVVLGGGAGHLFGFLTTQSDRGLQVEAPVSTPYAWAAMLHLPGAAVVYNQDIVTFQVTGAGDAVVSALTTPVLVLVAAAIAIIGVIKVRAGASQRRLLPPLALAMVLAFIVCNKVGSPQFQIWLIAPIVLWILWSRRGVLPYALLSIASALLTQFIYPITYDRVLTAHISAVLLLTARNAILVAMLVALIVHLVRLPVARSVVQAGVTASISDIEAPAFATGEEERQP
ncbi:glycosyltransferase 87 family protein [Microbacterium sp. ZW T5_56]|uniref:glycosyltransferase 87 family protein n=1 Tax=Microbacterium sp. ZW T5_56 TaxID=3378081 RepID=UPI003851BD2E